MTLTFNRRRAGVIHVQKLKLKVSRFISECKQTNGRMLPIALPCPLTYHLLPRDAMATDLVAKWGKITYPLHLLLCHSKK